MDPMPGMAAAWKIPSLSRRRLMASAAGGAAGTAAAAVATACGAVGGESAPKPAAERVTIEHYNYIDQTQLDRMKAIWDRFNSSQPNIRVEHLPAVGGEAEKREKMQTLVAGGTPPAVVGQIVAQYPSYYVLPGLVEPIDALITADKIDKKLFSQIPLDTFKYKGAQYALPYGASMEVIAYNRELFDKQSVKRPPSTWDDPSWTVAEFMARAQALTKAPAGAPEQFGLARPGAGWVGWPLMWGTDWVSEDLTRFQSALQPVMDSLQNRQDVTWRQHIAPQPTETGIFGSLSSSQRFLSGKIAMADLGTWYLPAWIKQATFAWDVAPYFRGATSSAAAPIYPVGEAIGKGTKYRQQAWQFVKFLTTKPEINLDYAFLKGAGPALLANLTPWRTLLAKEAPGINVQVLADTVGKYGRVGRVHFTARFDDISKLISAALTKVENNELPAKTALEQVAPQVQQLLVG